MASLKAIKAHAVSVGNIQKITNTIKMVATSKFMIAENILRHVRSFGEGTRRFYVLTNISYDAKEGRSAVVTSDRGLCGGLHTKVCKKVRSDQSQNPSEGGIVCLGEKAKSLLALHLKRNFRLIVNGLGNKVPTFKQASTISNRIFGEWHLATLTFPVFHNIMSYDVIAVPMMTSELVSKSAVPFKYELDQDDLEFYLQFSAASLIFYAMNEAFVCELSNRITAMSVASRNAGKMKKYLMLQFNRKRQEKITTEINDIISGLKATEKKRKTVRKLEYLMDKESPKGPSQELLQYLPVDDVVQQIQAVLLKPKEGSEEITVRETTERETTVKETTGRETTGKETTEKETKVKETPEKKPKICTEDDREPEF